MRKTSKLFVDLVGRRFGKWEVLRRSTSRPTPTKWVCRCECGTVRDVVGASLTRGVSKCCGCDRANLAATLKSRSTTHGRTNTPEWRAWNGMLARCYTPSHTSFHLYGGRNVQVCERWRQSFDNFFADLGERPAGCSLGRIDNARDYSPENVRWETDREQMNNTRSNRLLTYGGLTLTVAQWSRRTGISYTAIWQRLDSGWTVEDALTKPVRRKTT